LGIDSPHVARWLVKLDGNRELSALTIPPPAVLDALRKNLLIQDGFGVAERVVVPELRHEPSLSGVKAVNFELTYDCNRSCSHCIQQGIREQRSGLWLSEDVGRQALHDAWFAGLVSDGVNFTGGELFLPDSNLPEFVEAARTLKLRIRINTNGWWGKQETVQIGKMKFRSPGHVVGWLKEMGVAGLALSLDGRYHEHPEDWPPVVAIVRECDRQHLAFQLVFTVAEWYGKEQFCRRMLREAGISFDHHVVPMPMIDLGGAVRHRQGHLDSALLAPAVRQTGCRGTGFYTPSLLHIAPDGGVRTCLDAPGGSWLGNINRESLLSIVNQFSEAPVTTAFYRGNLAKLADKFIQPYAETYRPVGHACAAMAVLARAIDQCSSITSQEELRQIHERIAEDMNLRAN
jgi:MoaA/NifB/PqqE/SkfB family radical SAM enzyme